MNQLSANISKRLSELGMTQKTLADKSKVSQVTIHKLISGKAKTTSKIILIARALDCDPEWLETGVSSLPLGMDKNIIPLGTREHNMPLISWVNAGVWCESPNDFAPGDAEEWLPKPKNAGPRSFALRVEGDSMTSPHPGQRSYPPGVIIYVDPDRDAANGSRVVARDGSGGYTFKTYVEDAGRIYLKPINPTWDKIDVTECVWICGVVIGSYLPE